MTAMNDMPIKQSDYWTGPALTPALVAAAEDKFGYQLPRSLVDLLFKCNGGKLKAKCFPTTHPTSWADDHFAVNAILGIGGPHGFFNDDDMGSDYLITEWEYPAIGVVFCETPSAGHDTVMLDYRGVGPMGEPAVAYIDEDSEPLRVADSFTDFVNGLRTESQLGS